MDVARRQLIYVTRDPSETLCARFEERGWHIEIVASARDTRKALRNDLATGGCWICRAISNLMNWRRSNRR